MRFIFPPVLLRLFSKSVSFCIILYHFPKGLHPFRRLSATVQLGTVPSWSDAQGRPTLCVASSCFPPTIARMNVSPSLVVDSPSPQNGQLTVEVNQSRHRLLKTFVLAPVTRRAIL